jgi:hypothetical protein
MLWSPLDLDHAYTCGTASHQVWKSRLDGVLLCAGYAQESGGNNQDPAILCGVLGKGTLPE